MINISLMVIYGCHSLGIWSYVTVSDSLHDKGSVKYNDIEGFPISTVSGHNSDFVSGYYKNNQILLARGRFHFYEGYELETIVQPIIIFNELGIKNIIITNSSGSMKIKKPSR